MKKALSVIFEPGTVLMMLLILAAFPMSAFAASMDDTYFNEEFVRIRDPYRNINIINDNGVVTVTGHVDTESQRSHIINEVSDIRGVKAVKDEINVRQARHESRVGEYLEDTGITTVVKSKFLAQKGLDSLDISVKTVDGIVTLSGQVDEASQIPLAESTAREADGVRQVINNLRVK